MAIIKHPTDSKRKPIEGLYEVAVDDDGVCSVRVVKQKAVIQTTELYFDNEDRLQEELVSYGLEEEEINNKIDEAQKEAFDKYGGQQATDKPEPRPLSTIAREIEKDWVTINPSGQERLKALKTLNSINDMYYLDSAKEIVLYFLNDARTWRGEKARAIKKELKALVGIK